MTFITLSMKAKVGEGGIDLIDTITCYILPIDCLSIALDAHMLSHNGYGPRTRAQGPRSLIYPERWVPGPYPLWLNICASRAIDRQSIGNI